MHQQHVASYHADPEALPGTVEHVNITRNFDEVKVTWDGTPHASGYDVDIDLSDGSKVLVVEKPNHRTVTFKARGTSTSRSR